MCTAVSYQTKDFYFGRTLDHLQSYGEEVTVMPRRFPLPFRDLEPWKQHYAMIGMAHVVQEYPLFFDGVNEKGLAMAGLNFPGYAQYAPPDPGKCNIASFELIPWLLGSCANTRQALEKLEELNLTDRAFSRELPPAQLHWLLADREGAYTLEATARGLEVYPNPVGVLTNNPPFPVQMFRLRDFQHLSPEEPENRFAQGLSLEPYSFGMGAMGLPGDLSSQSRFVRAAFTKCNSLCGNTEGESVSQFFHILESVSQTRGCTRVGDGWESTLYTSCCNGDKGIYYYTTYGNRQITAVHMHRESLDGEFLIRYPLIQGEQIHCQN